ncbi:MAG TPA: 30S ribosomal protein S13 [Thermotogota bacterium]|nr:30S ribosomal protein S13 [Thermotogota bacterium]HRW91351.1 30S ribosomal protein S13 [Thermotogota bacterium]
MARVLGVEIPNNKKLFVALQYLYGIGPTRSEQIIAETELDREKRVKELNEDEIRKITQYVNANYKVEGELRQEVQKNIKRLVEIGSYRGFRHRLGLPVRGQRTKTNARTRKGRKPGIGKKKK